MQFRLIARRGVRLDCGRAHFSDRGRVTSFAYGLHARAWNIASRVDSKIYTRFSDVVIVSHHKTSLLYRLKPLYPSAPVGLSHINVALGIDS